PPATSPIPAALPAPAPVGTPPQAPRTAPSAAATTEAPASSRPAVPSSPAVPSASPHPPAHPAPGAAPAPTAVVVAPAARPEVRLPTGGVVGLSVAASVAVLAGLWRLRQRVTRTPGDPTHPDPGPQPPPTAASLEQAWRAALTRARCEVDDTLDTEAD